jgi:transcriptional regulator with XRE-family HTH domain
LGVKRKRKPTKRKPRRDIHGRILQLRRDRGLTQEQLANACGVDKTAVSHWEKGLSAPKSERIPQVASALGVTIDELYKPADKAA